jgi:integrase/recombinase XerD
MCRYAGDLPGLADRRSFCQEWVPPFEESDDGQVRLGHRLVDDYSEMVRVRARRNSLLAAGFDLKVFFTVVAKDPLEVSTTDVMAFVKAQRRGPGKAVRIADGASGMALSTLKGPLSTVGVLCLSGGGG